MPKRVHSKEEIREIQEKRLREPTCQPTDGSNSRVR